jgi:hypothetical protein
MKSIWYKTNRISTLRSVGEMEIDARHSNKKIRGKVADRHIAVMFLHILPTMNTMFLTYIHDPQN